MISKTIFVCFSILLPLTLGITESEYKTIKTKLYAQIKAALDSKDKVRIQPKMLRLSKVKEVLLLYQFEIKSDISLRFP